MEHAFSTLLQRPLRYLMAGMLFSLACALGTLLCLLPGLLTALTLPIYANRIFNSDAGIIESLLGSFQAVYGSERGLTFIGIEILVILCIAIVSLCTCGIGGLVALPTAGFYLQNSAYRQGVLR